MIVSVRTPAYAALVAELEQQVPKLKGRIAVEADRDDKMAWPKLGIRVVKSTFMRFQRRKVYSLAGATVYDCGHFDSLVQLRLGAPTHRQRVDLGEQVLGAFLGDGSAAGGLNIAVPEIYGATACWDLDDEAWNDEMVFDNKFWAVLTVTGRIPALAKVTTTKIETLKLQFDDGVGGLETVYIQQDGSLTLTP